MEEKDLGKLEKIDIREIWKDEAKDFTPWLARENNMALLSEEIGIAIKPLKTEASVGSFNVDILAEEENTGKKVVIENQLTATDHDHLGKIITYASGYDANFIIWIVRDVREPHKQAIDWLNEHTNSNLNFFLVKIELWKIANSPVAPKFTVVSKPNDWSKVMRNLTTGLSPLALQELEFIGKFIDYCKENKTILKLSKPSPSTPAYYQISIGTSKAWIAVKINNDKKQLRLDIYFVDKNTFAGLKEEYLQNIENELGYKIRWDEMPENKGAVAGISRKFEIEDTRHWNEHMKWLKENAEKFYKVFPKYIKKIKLSTD